MPGRIAVVDEQDRFVRWEERPTIHEQRLVHRSVNVLVFDGAGRLLLQRRHRSKQTFPGCWDLSCSGHVEESDYPGHPDEHLERVYAEVAARELQEELGIRAPLEPLAHFPPEPGVHYEQMALFLARSDGPYVLQATEVEEVRPVTPAALRAMLDGGHEPVTASLRHVAGWLRRSGLWS
jgi:isopentenyl-diphosphate Delta-isomerase